MKESEITKLTAYIKQRFDASDEEFARLFSYMEQRHTDIEVHLQEKADKKDVDTIIKTLDQVIKNQEINTDERLVMGHQLDRHNRWLNQLAKKIGYELTA